MTKLRKKIVHAGRKVKSTASAVKSANRKLTNAQLEAQIALLEEQNALLLAQCGGEGIGNRGKGIGNREDVRTETLSPIPYSLSPNHDVRIPPPKLYTPVLEHVTAVGSRFMRVTWLPSPYAGGYLVMYSPDGAFLNHVNAVTTDATTTAATISGLAANTTYYVRVQAVAGATGSDSDFSLVKSATTGVAANDDTAMHLQNWLNNLENELQNMTVLLPQLDTTELSSADRRRLNGSGGRRYGFIEKTADIADDFPQIWPGLVDKDLLNEQVNEIEVLRNLLIWLRTTARVVQDLLLIAGDRAFRLSGAYYAAARDGARRKNPEAMQVYNMLKQFWRKQRLITAEPTSNAGWSPTKQQVKRDFNGLQNGTKEGDLYVANESDKIVKGKKVVVDNVVPKQHGGMKFVESAEIE